MKKIAVCAAVIICLAGCGNNDADKNQAEMKQQDNDWITLFDGNSLDGWHGYGGGDLAGRWKIYDSTLILDSSVKLSGANGNLITDDEFDNFHLKLDWMISQNGNSGILFYVHEDTAQYSEPSQTGPEMQVLDNNGHPDAKIARHRAGDLYDLIASKEETVKPVGEWNHAEIVSNNGKLDLFLNGTNVVSTTMWDAQWDSLVASSKFKSMPGFANYKKGSICLQDHGDVVSYKNIVIKKL